VRVVPVPAQMLTLGIVVTLTIYRSRRTRGTAGRRGKPVCPREAGVDLWHAGGSMNISSMGSTVSVLEKVALKSLLELVDRANVKLTEGEISGLLLWCR